MVLAGLDDLHAPLLLDFEAQPRESAAAGLRAHPHRRRRSDRLGVRDDLDGGWRARAQRHGGEGREDERRQEQRQQLQPQSQDRHTTTNCGLSDRAACLAESNRGA
jgi:hypothetical protein